MPLRGDNWYAERDIDLRRDTRVASVNPNARTVTLENGETVQYAKLLLATGAVPRQLRSVPGADMQGIYTLRTQGDADKIIAALEKGKRVVVVGASFIGLEVAASLAGGRSANVTVVAPE